MPEVNVSDSNEWDSEDAGKDVGPQEGYPIDGYPLDELEDTLELDVPVAYLLAAALDAVAVQVGL